jgi:uncharacterized repeat protein (TIGR01451 family)
MRSLPWLIRLAGLLLTGVAHAQSGTPTVTQVAGGGDHSCAVTSAGAVKCWGDNALGQLGNGVTGPVAGVPTPVGVQTLGAGAVAVTAGTNHTCALTVQGAVKCWGAGSSGRLGNGANGSSSVPVDALTLGQGVVAIAAGDYHGCALTDRGAVKCWGWNRYGQLGSATNLGNDSANSPLDVQTLGSGAVAIAVGQLFSCAVTTAGAVKCWGINDSGQLGNTANLGTETANGVPLPVQTLTSGAVSVAAGDSHACALLGDGTVKCWGLNNYGQLGNVTNAGNSTFNISPLSVFLSATRMDAGLDHTCAVNDQGAPLCWGRNEFGQLGVAANAGTQTPTWQPAMLWNPVSTGVAAANVTGGDTHACALTTTGALRCWGRNSRGQLGNTANLGSYSAAPLPVAGFDLPAQGQSITFTAPQKLRLHTSVALSAGATSGGTVAFDTWSANSCVIAGNTLSPAAGAVDGMLCGVRASQPGSGSWAAAPQQLRILRVVREDHLTVGVTGQGAVAATPAPSAGGGISACTAANAPCTASYVTGDATAITLIATPAAHWHVAAWSGDCTADGANPSQATLNLAGDKSCHVTFAIDTVTASVTMTSGNGTVTPPSRTVNYGSTTTFTVNAAAGHQASISGCGGSLAGTTYTTGALTADCAITALFTPITYSVTATAVGGNGSIAPPLRTVNHGDTTTFTVNADAGYQANVSGCGGSLTGNTYTTGAITAACTVTASFAAIPPALSLAIDADRDYVGYGQVLRYTVSLSNTGPGPANPALITLALPPQIDAGATTWTCTNGGNGAQCTASGVGALQDSTVVLPPGRTLTWQVTAPVRPNATGGNVVTTVTASAGAVSANASDSVVLVLMRDGFETTGGN